MILEVRHFDLFRKLRGDLNDPADRLLAWLVPGMRFPGQQHLDRADYVCRVNQLLGIGKEQIGTLVERGTPREPDRERFSRSS